MVRQMFLDGLHLFRVDIDTMRPNKREDFFTHLIPSKSTIDDVDPNFAVRSTCGVDDKCSEFTIKLSYSVTIVDKLPSPFDTNCHDYTKNGFFFTYNTFCFLTIICTIISF